MVTRRRPIPPAFLACAAACLFGLASCESVPHDKASSIVAARYPGARELDKCAPYADALFNALKANDIEAWKVSYMCGSWEKTYFHAIVVYKDAGSFWFVDNIFPFPTKSWGKTPRECAKDRSERDSDFCLVLKVVPSRPDPTPAPPAPAAAPAPDRATLTPAASSLPTSPCIRRSRIPARARYA